MSRRLLFIGEFLIIDVSYPVKKMLDYGVDPNLANDDGLTSLHQVSRVSLRSGLTYLSKWDLVLNRCNSVGRDICQLILKMRYVCLVSLSEDPCLLYYWAKLNSLEN